MHTEEQIDLAKRQTFQVLRHRTRRRDVEDPPRQLRLRGIEVLRGLDDDDLLAR